MIRRCLIVLGGLALLNPAQAISHIVGLPLISRGSTSSRSLAAQTGPASPNPQTALIPARKFVITDFGAVGDGKTLNTDAFRKTLAACRDAAGGEVIVPAGAFVTAPITLTSHMALVIEKGATLRGSGDFRDYQKTTGEFASKQPRTSVLPLIGGSNLTDVEIRGEGTIDGAGAAWWNRFRAERAAGVPAQGQPRAPGQPAETPRPKLLWLTGCNRVHIQGVTLTNSPQFHLVPQGCSDVLIEDVSIIAPADSPNTDGIDPTGSRVAITINLFYFDQTGRKARETKPVTATTPTVRSLRVINVTVNEAKTAGEIIGLPEMPISDVLLDNVRIKSKSGMTVRDANSVELRDVQIVPQKGEPLDITHSIVKTTKGS